MDISNEGSIEYDIYVAMLLIAGRTTCTLSIGDGQGASEVKVGLQTGLECVKACIERRNSDPTINGVTVKNDNSEGCWCEREMNNIEATDTIYKACYLIGEILYLRNMLH